MAKNPSYGGTPARGYAREALAANTLRAYRADWEDFAAWCQLGRAAALPAAPGTVAAYLASLAATYGRSALRRRLSATGQAHRLKGLDWQPGHPAAASSTPSASRDAAVASPTQATSLSKLKVL